jgi:hypothetical protein
MVHFGPARRKGGQAMAISGLDDACSGLTAGTGKSTRFPPVFADR